MATNKWLSDLQTLKSTTDTLRTTLRNKNVKALDTDTLPTLVSKVPSLAPIVESEDDKWKPDPLWKFPDPNGTETTKTIREIYDEDALASSYTYRGIYQIRGEDDTIDLKAVMGKRTSADTFILSDGTTYENITANTLVHTWNKDKDVTDSKGYRQRYVRIYSNSSYSYVPGFYNNAVWIIHNLNDSTYSIASAASNTSYLPYACDESPVECIEIERNNSQTSTSNYIPVTKNLKKLVFKPIADISTSSGTHGYNLKELSFDYLKSFGIQSYVFGTEVATIKYFDIDPSKYSASVFYLEKSTSFQFIDMSVLGECNTVNTCRIGGQSKLKQLIIPPNTTYLVLGSLWALRNVIIPNKCEKIEIKNCLIQELDIPETVKTLNITYLPELKRLTIPIGFNISFSISQSLKMEHDSIVNILENLKDLTGETAKTLTLGSVNLAKLTDEEKAIATNKNWTLA